MDNVNSFGDEDFVRGRYAADAGVHARFYTVAVHNEDKSATEGRPIYDEKDWIEIIASGNANNIIRRKASDEDKQRFHRQYTIFERDRSLTGEQLTGTPLAEVSWVTKSQVAEMAYMRIHTLEQLAVVDDNTCSRFAGLYDMKRKAKAAMEAAQKSAPMTEMALQMEQMKVQLEELLAQNKLLKESKSKDK
jgi:hypothetical protein